MKIDVIRYLQQYAEIPEEDGAIILACFSRQLYKAGSYLSRAGQRATHVYFINSGLLKITVPQGDEKEATYYFVTAQQFMGFLYSYHGDIPAAQGLQAVIDTEVMVIEIARLIQLYDRFAYLKEVFTKLPQIAVAAMINQRNAYLGLSTKEKYLRLLDMQPEVARLAPLADIASYLEMTPQSLSRVRRQLNR